MTMAMGRRAGPVADINVTPMADVIVVLLIIFMITVPALSNDPSVQLPDAANGAKRESERLVVTLSRNGDVRIGVRELTTPELLGKLQAGLLALAEADRIVYVRADESLPYSQVERILDLARQAGAEQVALMTAPRAR
jgi:biopolymer transport protein ExbD